MSKLFASLRARMIEADVDQEHLGEIIYRSLSAVNRRMNNKEDWTQSEQYTIMDELRIPYDQMHLIFPKGGKR